VADAGNGVVRRITPAGTTSTLPAPTGGFAAPVGLAVDPQGNVYVALVGNNTISKITAAGVVSTFAGTGPTPGHSDGTGASASFFSPEGLAFDAAGNLYVADTGNHTIRKITPAGAVTTLAGSPEVLGNADGTGDNARFREPTGVATDGAGNVFVADWGNNAIRKITPAGAVTTVAGLPTVDGSDDGVGTNARFWLPAGVTVDAAGNIFVTDSHNQTVRKITPDGTVSTIAGLPEARGSAAGQGDRVRFNHPQGIALDATGTLYVTNSSGTGNTVVKGVIAGRPAITTQPQAVTATAGGTAQFSVTATGDPAPTYQWYLNGTALTGATAATFSLNSVQAAHAGDYTVIVTNPKGSVTSNKATLTVTAAPAPPAPPVSSGGGGGGAPSTWFLTALLALGLMRRSRGRLRL
jgi:sugar lactone lactonase YvrE